MLLTGEGGLQLLESFPYSPWIHIQHLLKTSEKPHVDTSLSGKNVEGTQVNSDLHMPLLFISCVTLGKLLNLSEPHFPECYHPGLL